jgi:hypothetical protein
MNSDLMAVVNFDCDESELVACGVCGTELTFTQANIFSHEEQDYVQCATCNSPEYFQPWAVTKDNLDEAMNNATAILVGIRLGRYDDDLENTQGQLDELTAYIARVYGHPVSFVRAIITTRANRASVRYG